MKKYRKQRSSRQSRVLEIAPGFLSVKQVASLLGLSERSIYGYIQEGKLPGERIGSLIMVAEEAVAMVQRNAAGRKRTTTPPWRRAPEQNSLSLTMITLRQHPEQRENLEDRLNKMRQEQLHCLPGSAARYIMRNRDDPNEIALILAWRSCIMPTPDEQEAALVALRTHLAEVLDWETAIVKECRSLLHA